VLRGQSVGNGNSGSAELMTSVMRLVFSLLFPLSALVSTAVASRLVVDFHLSQFMGWPNFMHFAYLYAEGHDWAKGVFGIFIIAALPLAWLAYKETGVKASETVGGIVFLAIWIGGPPSS
jgi:hypothetical protein